MADIHPFRAFRYDPLQLSLSQVATQPYDKITSALQDRYYAASPYNLVRIILGRREENDNAVNNVYSRAAGYFRDWRQEGILRQDSNPSLYIYSQCFKLPGSTNELERRGFIGLGRIEDYSAGVVFRHEQTLAKPKADRLDLLRATRAHFGQIFMLYEDSGEVESLLATNAEPDISVTDEYGVIHRVWQVSDPGAVSAIRDAMSDKKLIIADGHHRYETALTYRNERRAAKSSGSASESGAAPYEFVMMTFVNMNSPGLLILPTHRLVHGLASFSEEKFRSSARAFFDVDEVDSALDAPRATVILREAGRTGTSILAVTANRAFLLHHPNPNTPEVFARFSVRQQALDVVQLHKCLLEGVLNLSEESIRNQENISYVRDASEALSRVRAAGGPCADIAFLMNPCRMAQVRNIAFAGEVMPQKSTDFYPKLLSGLTIYALD
ncbi:MAG TPA: DUF1015 domain-containing protein [Verrucomicrobiae bacterium]|jgi:uncharacterized protein (DUF1015 family)|nr:DUF1015 domain-containing protein [Verrucomicrobiae bacterium]